MFRCVCAACIFSLPGVASAQVIWAEDFDGYTRDYICSNTGGGACEHPNQYTYMYGDTSSSAEPDTAITTEAERANPGGSNARGFRLYKNPGSSPTSAENKLCRYGLDIGTDFYLRWYQRISVNTLSSYAKIFRITVGSSGSQRLIFDWYNRYSWGGKTRLLLASEADGFSADHSFANFTLEDDYTAGTWICIEAFINQSADQWCLWIDGVSKGCVDLPNDNYDITGIEIGGNQTAEAQQQTIDYDDLVVSTSYIGPDDSPTRDCADDIGGVCCAAGQTCAGGAFVASSDCAELCCLGGTCESLTCEGSGYFCCESCASGPQPGFDSDCDAQVCCAACDLTCGDELCEPGEDCASCPDDCPTGLGEVCCLGTIETGDCCGDGDCTGGAICCGYQCTSPPACPSCDDGDACTADTCVGAGECAPQCQHEGITSCADGDGCCPVGCTAVEDDDCLADVDSIELGDHTGSTETGRGEDTFLDLSHVNHVADPFLRIYTWPAGMPANVILMKWDLSVLPASVTIQRATLSLFLADIAPVTSAELYELSAHPVVNHDPDLGAADGYTYDGTNEWSASSCCSDDIPLAHGDLGPSVDAAAVDTAIGYKVWDVTDLVTSWYATPAENFGMAIVPSAGAVIDANRYFASSDHVNADWRPKLEIVYASAAPQPDGGPSGDPDQTPDDGAHGGDGPGATVDSGCSCAVSRGGFGLLVVVLLAATRRRR